MKVILPAAAVASGFVALGSAKVARTSFMLTRARHVGMSPRAFQLVGIAELAGAAGVAVGLRLEPVGHAAGAGLLVLLGGAVVLHLRRGETPREVVPATVFAGGTVAYMVALRGAR